MTEFIALPVRGYSLKSEIKMGHAASETCRESPFSSGSLGIWLKDVTL